MIEHDTLLVTLAKLVGRVPGLPPPAKRRRGRPSRYPDRLFLQALVMMIVRRLHTVHALLSVLAQPTPEMQTLRALLMVDGRFPTRHTGERRLHAIPATMPAQIRCLGRALVAAIQPWATGARPPSTARSCAPAVGSGIRRIARPALCPTLPLIRRRTGSSRAGTGGSTGGGCTWSRPSQASGFHWRPTLVVIVVTVVASSAALI
jgi:hypothetical protein